MNVSCNWLGDYVSLDMKPEELAQRLMMAGLNLEAIKQAEGGPVLDLEITSNRPDCLGHIGVAREVAVLYNRELKVKSPTLREGTTPVESLTKVSLQCPQLCYRYTARVIRGANVKSSPDWLARRLRAIGVPTINNIVDITNYVLMECGQPLHAFDFAKLRGREIVVREARQGEAFLAIDHKPYTLDAGMCVIADATHPVALGGVMGGAETEISPSTTELLIEAADFAPLSIRNTARKLNLHSDSSYRFERGVDPAGVDWASRRCCELILELAGGELAAGMISVGRDTPPAQPITFRFAQLKRILGIDVPADDVVRILTALGGTLVRREPERIEITAPSWRRDLTREIDLVEEVARIHGYDKIPEDVGVPMAPSHRRDDDRVLATVRSVLMACGFDESLSASVVREEWTKAFPAWTSEPPLYTHTPMLKGANYLRNSLIPSLLDVRHVNESLSNPVIELFETARIYLRQPDGQLPLEQWTLGLTSGGDYYAVKGVVESLAAAIAPQSRLKIRPVSQSLLDAERSSEVLLNGQRLGFIGELTSAAQKQFGLRGPASIAELNLSVLGSAAVLIPKYQPQSSFPAMARDLNMIVDEPVRWGDLSTTVSSAAGPLLEELRYLETYRDTKKDGEGKKRLLFTMTLRTDRTLTNEEADQIRQRVVEACQAKHGAVLLA